MILDEVTVFVADFVAFQSDAQRDAVALWIAHAHAFGAAETTPRLAVQSAEKQSGKTRLLEVLEVLVPAPLSVANISPAALFRVVHAGVEDGAVTVLMDEVDAIFGPKANGSAEELRALLNAGYRKGATVARVEGKEGKFTVKRFSVFAPAALAGIGTLPDTIQDRSIIVRLKRRARGESVQKFRRRDVVARAEPLRLALSSWLGPQVKTLADARPSMPDELADRAADCWEPLLAIADAAGEDWPARARAAALELSGHGAEDESLNVRLLADLRSIFEDVDRLGSIEVVDRLKAREESPWGDWMDARTLARRLRGFDVRPRALRDGATVFKGYRRDDLEDAFTRYLPSPGNDGYTVTSVTGQASTDPVCNRATDVTDLFDTVDVERAVEAMHNELDAEVIIESEVF